MSRKLRPNLVPSGIIIEVGVGNTVRCFHSKKSPSIHCVFYPRLGERHVEYGTLDSHYPAVGATLLKSLAEVAGDQWNDQLQEAWADAYEAIAGLMMEGAAVPSLG